MTAERLQQAALIRFAEQGYNATTMNEIASDVGIKKASIYAHFRNKDELFLSLLPMMVEREFECVKSIIVGKSIREELYQYLAGISDRFESSHQVQFWLRILFAPPIHLYDEVVLPMHQFMLEMESYIFDQVEKSAFGVRKDGLSAEVITANYMGLIDSLHTELLFAGKERFERRLAVMWEVFDRAISLER